MAPGAHCPRNHPNDFRLKSKYRVGVGWPFSYQDIAPYYQEAEQVMLIAGPDDIALHGPGAGQSEYSWRVINAIYPKAASALPDGIVSYLRRKVENAVLVQRRC